MQDFWLNFIRNNGGEYNAREQFDRLCIELLEYHYPGKQIINANKIDKIESFHDLLLVYLPKLFTDSLNVSRKSQIRKAFNKTLEAVEQHNLKVFKFVVCTSYQLKQSELQWWNQWKYRNQEQHNIEIELLDGQQIYNLLEKYGLLEKWSGKPQTEETAEQQPADEQILDLEFDNLEPAGEQEPEIEVAQESEETATGEETTGQEQEQQTEPQQPETTEQAVQAEQAQATQTEQEETQPEHEQETTEAEPEEAAKPGAEEKSPQGEEKIKRFVRKKQAFVKTVELTEKLDPQVKEKFEKLREISSIKTEKFKDQPDVEQALKEKIIDVFFKARNAEIEKDYDKALFYYEILQQRKEELKQKLKAKVPEIDRSLKFVEKQLDFEQKILQGDLALAKGNKLEALEYYEEALKLNDNDYEALVKYNETLGDLMVESGLYNEAVKAYEEAKSKLKRTFEDHYKLLEKKLKLAKALKTYTELKFLPVIADLYLLKAKNIEQKYLDEPLVNISEYYRLKKTSIGLGIVTGLILGIWIFSLILKNTSSRDEQPLLGIPEDYTLAQSAYSLYDIAMKRGDYFMEKFNRYGYLRVHVLDSAAAAYKRAMDYGMYRQEAVDKYKKAKKILDGYVAAVQQKVKQNPEKYVVVLGKESEGLRFFKFLFKPGDKSYGKYGYLDENNNIAIPPLFDFDYNRHIKPGWQNFRYGKAVVCVVVQPGDTAYFMINRKGQRISKVYHIGPKKKAANAKDRKK